MINFTNITKAVKEVLDEANTNSLRYTVTRNQPQNTDEGRAVKGWIGIYRDGVEYEPYTTGSRKYVTNVKTRIEVQTASIASSEDCESKLEELISFITAALSAAPTLKGYVGMMKGLNIDYDDNYAEVNSIYFQTATIELMSEVMS